MAGTNGFKFSSRGYGLSGGGGERECQGIIRHNGLASSYLAEPNEFNFGYHGLSGLDSPGEFEFQGVGGHGLPRSCVVEPDEFNSSG